jgi:glyoxylase-like metal-dependent hydrolase (beta-lactamase superfamily II)
MTRQRTTPRGWRPSSVALELHQTFTMLVRQLFDKTSSTYTYLLVDRGEAALIDPVREHIDRDLELIRELGAHLVYVFETHVHADHVTGAGELRTRTGAKTATSATGAPCSDIQLVHGRVLRLGDTDIVALATPGHTDDSMSFRIAGAVFTGDTLLVRGCGRSDFQNGSSAQLYDSLTRVLWRLPDDTIVYPGHDYNGHTSSTIGEEKCHNARVAGRTRDEFIALMDALRLPPPAKLVEAVQANRACGAVASE